MITFIPKWENISREGVSADDLIGKIRAFTELDKMTNVVIVDYLPNLNSFLYRHGLLESNYQSTFDVLQGFTDCQQKFMKVSDLDFSEEIKFYYTPFNILALKQQQVVGKIFFNNESQISDVHYLKNGKITAIKKYNDRGRLSSQIVFSDGHEQYMEYLDSCGQWIFKHYTINDECFVNPQNLRGLKKLRYDTLEELKFELLEVALEKRLSMDPIIISATDKNIKYIAQSPYLSQMTLSLFQEKLVNFEENSIDIIRKYAQGIIVDSPQTDKNVKDILGKNYHIIQINPYDTIFALSRTQEIKEEIIFIDVRSNNQIESVILNILSYIWDKINEDYTRNFQAIFRINSHEYYSVSKVLKKILLTVFPDEMEQIALLKNVANSENLIDAEFIDGLDEVGNLVNKLYNSVKFKVIDTDDELAKIFRNVRLSIDVQDKPDIFTQIAGISAAVPQINTVATEYVIHKKNGWILSDIGELYTAMDYYLETLQHWQEARVSSIKQMKLYSGPKLVNNILNFIQIRKDGKKD